MNPMPHFPTGKRIFILLHVAGWIIVLILPLYFFNTQWAANTSFISRYYVSAVIYGMIFYMNYFLLVPKLFLNKKIILYLMAVTALIILLFYLEGYFSRFFFTRSPIEKEIEELFRKFNEEHHLSGPPFRQFHLYNFFFTSILISGFALGLRVSEKFAQQEKKQEELAKVNLKNELAFLKNQVSPHFFFNTLNNIYSLVEINSADAQKAILQLSQLMRYLLYDSDQIKVSLRKELEFMKSYIDLMKLRLSNKVDLQISFPELNIDFQIPPLLFIPFIENAFKHGVSYREACFIHISFEFLEGDLLFNCTNSIIENGNKDDRLFPGIGLENVRKRLELLFPEQFDLKLDQFDRVYEVNLRIKGINNV